MAGFLPDPVMVEVLAQGDQQPYRIRLTLPDGSGDTAELPLAACEQAAHFEDAGSGAVLEAYGRALYSSLLPGNLSNQYSTALKAAGQRGIRLSLRLDETRPALHRIPWERMFQPQGSQWVPLAASPQVYFSRFLQTGQPWGLPLLSGPLKVLVVISSPFPQDNPLAVKTDLEHQAIAQILDEFPGQIEYDVLEGAVTLQQIADRLGRGSGFDVLYYVGHGDYREDEQAGYLILTGTYADGSRGPVGASSTEIVRMLSSSARLPQLILLAACESGQQSTNNAFAGMGPALVRAGCPAVICMQEKVENEVARRFGQVFFQSVLENGCIDLATNRARAALLENQWAQWAVPVLYMHLVDGVLFDPRRRFRSSERQPYKFLAPYQREDSDLFKGRATKVAEIHQHLCDYDITVVYGDAGVGVTSVVEAGVRPAMEGEGWFVASITEYSDVAAEFRVQLQVDGHPVTLRVSGDAPLPELLRAAGSGPVSNLVLVMDQFERVFALPDANQQAILQSLQDSLGAVGSRLKLLVALHKDAIPDLVRFQPLLEGRSGTWIEILPLSAEDAVEAIVQPLDVLGWPVTLNPALAREQIVPDLLALTSDQQDGQAGDWIDPGQLQITCNWLYQKARQRRPPLIDEGLYLKEAGGAEGILVRYMEEQLQSHLAGQSDLAKKVLVAMAAPDFDRWVSPQQVANRICLDEGGAADVAHVAPVLDRLVQAELLVRKSKERQYFYTFTNQTVADEAVRLGGQKTEQSYNAGDELERIWRLWLALQVRATEDSNASDRALASRQQLRTLAEAGPQLDVRPVKVLLLLRSAVLRDEPVQPWLDLLQKKETEYGLIRWLERPEGSPNPVSASASQLAGRLLGLGQNGAAITPGGSYGPVAWAAASSAGSVDRRTAALALTVLAPNPQVGVSRLEAALDELPNGLRRSFHQAELSGTVADARPELAGLVHNEALKRPATSRAGTYLWRVWRRILHDRRWIAWLTWGSAIGGGLGLGLERALMGTLAQSHSGVLFFVLFSYWGLVLAGLTTLAMNLAGPLLLQRGHGSQPGSQRGRLEVLLGTTGFGLANLLVVVANKVQEPLVVPMGFLAGIGVSLLFLGRPQKRTSWLIRAAFAALFFALLQLFFVALPALGAGISISLSPGYFQVEFDQPRLLNGFVGWAALLSVVEAGLAGAFLVTGALAGRQIAERWYERLKDALDRLGE